MLRRSVLAGTAAVVAAARSAQAQGLPAGTLKIIVGYPAGGSTDVIARLVADKVKERLGRTVIVENKAGGSGLLGVEVLRGSPADGSAISLVPFTVAVLGPLVNRQATFDFSTDVAAVAQGVSYPLALSVANNTGVTDWAGFVAWAKANPGKASFGTAGAGGLPHFFGLLLGKAAGIDLVNVPYKGGAQLAQDLLGGQVPIGINVLSEVMDHHKTGKLRVLAISSGARNPSAPDIPTFKELGYADAEGDGWFAFFAPKATPRPAIDAWAAAINEALADAAVRAKIVAMGFIADGGPPQALSQRLASDMARWKPIVAASGFKLED
ncbi:MAG TPA: tripartite tricarboxylate transporter substrate-binding protein [Vineibacter sp.]|nr:tripartite tricarboxylate transporter substrate-binding protein [Vineibacter sp.]